jgi:hypothetical protein
VHPLNPCRSANMPTLGALTRSGESYRDVILPLAAAARIT